MLLPTFILIRRVCFLVVGCVVIAFFVRIPVLDVIAVIGLFPLTVAWLNYAWKKIFSKEPKKFWHISHIGEGIMALVVTVIAAIITISPLVISNYSGEITEEMGERLSIIFFILVVILYGIIGFLETINPFKSKAKQPKPLPTTAKKKTSPTKPKSPSTDDELNRLKQKVQSEDGYLSQSKPEPKDKKRRK